jgi:hypothetical protein
VTREDALHRCPESNTRLGVGATLPGRTDVRDVRLYGRRVSGDERETNRGLEVTVPATPGRSTRWS